MFGLRDPFEALLNLQRSLTASRASDWFGAGTMSRGAFPPINVFRQGDNIVLIAELPGIDKNHLEIEVKHNRIRIAGDKAIGYAEDASLHRRERVSGKFDRTFAVPMEIDADKMKAEYRNGILALFIPRAEVDKPKSIKIT